MAAPEETKTYYFPNPLASSEEKASKEYGLSYAKAIWARYMSDAPIFTQQKNRFILNRKYAEGLQSIEKYKDRMDVGDTSWMNLDFSPPAVIPKFVDNIVGLMSGQKYKIECDVLNTVSQTNEDKVRNELYARRLLKPLHDELAPKTGVPMVAPGNYIPEDEEEQELYMQQNFKPAEAMAMELAIQFVFNYSEFTDVEKLLLRDFVNLKMASVRTYYDENKKICAEYIDPVDLLYPYSKKDDFTNVPYKGILKKFTIQEIAAMTKQFSEEQLFNIAKQYAGTQYGNRPWAFLQTYEGYYVTNGTIAGRPWDDFYVPVVWFEFLGLDPIKYESKETQYGGTRLTKRKLDWEAPKDSKYNREVIEKTFQNRYEGFWIIGSEFLYNYKKSNNVPRPKEAGVYTGQTSLQTKIIAPGIYDMQNKSLTERMIPHGDMIQLINLKSQQLLMKAIPAGVYIDADAIEGVMKGVGNGTMSPLESLKMFQQTGSLVGRSRRADGSLINGKPIEILPNGIPPGFEQLDRMWQSEIQKIYGVIGYNEAADGVANSESLVGVGEQQIRSTTNSLRPLNDSFLKLIRMTAGDISLMVQDKIEYGDGLEGFERAIGKESIEVIRAAKGLPLCEFGISVNFLPTEQEQAMVQQDIQVALGEKSIELADAVQVREALKGNVKLAIQLLVYLQKKRRKERMQEAEHNSQLNSQQQQESAMAASQGEQQSLMLQAKTKKDLMAYEYQLKAQLSAQEAQQRQAEIRLQNQGRVQEKVIEHEANLSHASFEAAIAPAPEKKAA